MKNFVFLISIGSNMSRFLQKHSGNSDVECILRAKNTLIHLAGMGRWSDPTWQKEATIAIASVENIHIENKGEIAFKHQHTIVLIDSGLANLGL